MDNIFAARGFFGKFVGGGWDRVIFFNGQVCIYGNMDKWIRQNIENDK